jgi:hypothetical protein
LKITLKNNFYHEDEYKVTEAWFYLFSSELYFPLNSTMLHTHTVSPTARLIYRATAFFHLITQKMAAAIYARML